MGKLKTHSGASKRFKPTAKGGFKHRGAFRNHILTKKKQKNKRQLRANRMIHDSDVKSVARMLLVFN